MSTSSSAGCIATKCSALLLACAVLATATAAAAGTIAPKNIARLRSLDGRTLAAFAPAIRNADIGGGSLAQVGMHARIDGSAVQDAAYAWAARGDTRFLDRAASALRSAQTILTDSRNTAPLDPAQLDALIDGYGIVRSAIPANDRTALDGALVQTAHALAASAGRSPEPHRIDLIGRIGLLVDDSELAGDALAAFVDFVDAHIGADGRTDRAVQNDSLFDEVEDIEPLVAFALAAERNGRRIYTSTSDRGASLAGAVAYLEPFAAGRFAARRPWDPQTALRLFALASHFDARYDGLRIGQNIVGESATAVLARLDR